MWARWLAHKAKSSYPLFGAHRMAIKIHFPRYFERSVIHCHWIHLPIFFIQATKTRSVSTNFNVGEASANESAIKTGKGYYQTLKSAYFKPELSIIFIFQDTILVNIKLRFQFVVIVFSVVLQQLLLSFFHFWTIYHQLHLLSAYAPSSLIISTWGSRVP